MLVYLTRSEVTATHRSSLNDVKRTGLWIIAPGIASAIICRTTVTIIDVAAESHPVRHGMSFSKLPLTEGAA